MKTYVVEVSYTDFEMVRVQAKDMWEAEAKATREAKAARPGCGVEARSFGPIEQVKTLHSEWVAKARVIDEGELQ